MSAFKFALLNRIEFASTVFVQTSVSTDNIDTETGDEYSVRHYRCSHSFGRFSALLDRIEAALSGKPADTKTVCTAYMTVIFGKLSVVMCLYVCRRRRGRADRRKAASSLTITQRIMVTTPCRLVSSANSTTGSDTLSTVTDSIDSRINSTPTEAIIYILRRLTTNSHLLDRADKIIDIRRYIGRTLKAFKPLPTIANGFVINAQKYIIDCFLLLVYPSATNEWIKDTSNGRLSMIAARNDFVKISDEIDAPDDERDDDTIDAWAFGSRKKSFCYALIDIEKYKETYRLHGLFDYSVKLYVLISGNERYAFIVSIVYVGVGMSYSNERRLISVYRHLFGTTVDASNRSRERIEQTSDTIGRSGKHRTNCSSGEYVYICSWRRWRRRNDRSLRYLCAIMELLCIDLRSIFERPQRRSTRLQSSMP